ncbi:MAG: ABC transporter permease subunit, partial [Pseudomonadota bacterium]
MLIRSGITVVFLVILWQLIVSIFHLPAYILPGPMTVAGTFINQIHSISYQAIPTLIEIIFGLFFGILFGIFAALAVTYLQPARLFFLPILLISQSLPTFAIAPILVVWFGYGISAKIIVIIIMIFFPITSSFYDGLRQTPSAYMDMATITGASIRVFSILK